MSDGSRRWQLWLAIAGLAGILLVGYLAARPQGNGGPPPTRQPVSSSDLSGEWSGEGRSTRCAGFDRCDRTRTVTLTIDCSGKRCRVTPFDESYGSPPLRFRDSRYRAAGPVPADAAPRCDGVPTATDLWRLDLTVRDGRLHGSYAESTVQSFDCGATGVAWDVVLDRR